MDGGLKTLEGKINTVDKRVEEVEVSAHDLLVLENQKAALA